MNATTRTRRARGAAAVLIAAGLGLAACGGSSGGSGATTTTPADGTATTVAGGPVLPVTANPITNTATAQTLVIDSVLVENNVDAAGAAVDDHLEIALSNTGSADLTNVEVFYTFTDPTAGTSESYYAHLPSSFTIPAGGSNVVHFDNTGAANHFPANQYSLYATSTNALDVKVVVSADGAAVQTVTVQKDAGGAEAPD
jgi:hypothetical protein